MNIEFYNSFVAPEGSETHSIIKSILAERQKAHQVQANFVLSRKADSFYANERGVWGLVYKDARPTDKALKKYPRHTGEGYAYTPRLNTPEGKALSAEMAALPTAPANEAFAKRCKGPSFIIHGRFMCSPHIEKVNDKWFVFWPKTDDDETAASKDISEKTPFTPPGCRPAKLSEYYAAKEAEVAK